LLFLEGCLVRGEHLRARTDVTAAGAPVLVLSRALVEPSELFKTCRPSRSHPVRDAVWLISRGARGPVARVCRPAGPSGCLNSRLMSALRQSSNGIESNRPGDRGGGCWVGH